MELRAARQAALAAMEPARAQVDAANDAVKASGQGRNGGLASTAPCWCMERRCHVGFAKARPRMHGCLPETTQAEMQSAPHCRWPVVADDFLLFRRPHSAGRQGRRGLSGPGAVRGRSGAVRRRERAGRRLPGSHRCDGVDTRRPACMRRGRACDGLGRGRFVRRGNEETERGVAEAVRPVVHPPASRCPPALATQGKSWRSWSGASRRPQRGPARPPRHRPASRREWSGWRSSWPSSGRCSPPGWRSWKNWAGPWACCGASCRAALPRSVPNFFSWARQGRGQGGTRVRGTHAWCAEGRRGRGATCAPAHGPASRRA